MGVSDSGITGGKNFPTTSYSVLLHAGSSRSPEHQQHLQRLVQLYWKPVYCFLRRRWAKTNEDAKDLAQEFFATVFLDGSLLERFDPERGSFRSLLMKALTNFVRGDVRDAGREKRGGGYAFVQLDDSDRDLGGLLAALGGVSPEEAFETAWKHVVMARALDLLEQKLEQEGKALAFEVLRRYDLDMDRERLTYADLGRALDLTPDQVRHALVHARSVLREVVMDIVAGYVDGPKEMAQELRQLFGE